MISGYTTQYPQLLVEELNVFYKVLRASQGRGRGHRDI